MEKLFNGLESLRLLPITDHNTRTTCSFTARLLNGCSATPRNVPLDRLVKRHACPGVHPRSTCSHLWIATSAPPSLPLDPFWKAANLLSTSSHPQFASHHQKEHRVLCCLGEYAHNTPWAMHYWSYLHCPQTRLWQGLYGFPAKRHDPRICSTICCLRSFTASSSLTSMDLSLSQYQGSIRSSCNTGDYPTAWTPSTVRRLHAIREYSRSTTAMWTLQSVNIAIPPHTS